MKTELKFFFLFSSDVYLQVRRFSTVASEEIEKGLTVRDWRVLLAGAKEVSLETGHSILTMNTRPLAMFRLKSGKLRVFKPTPE